MSPVSTAAAYRAAADCAPPLAPTPDPTPLTAHALVRARQRGVDLDALACLLSYGRREHDHRGAEIVTFDHAALAEVARREPRPTWRKAVEASSLYAVLGADGYVITTGHRYRRVIRDRSLASLRPGRSRRARDAGPGVPLDARA